MSIVLGSPATHCFNSCRTILEQEDEQQSNFEKQRVPCKWHTWSDHGYLRQTKPDDSLMIAWCTIWFETLLLHWALYSCVHFLVYLHRTAFFLFFSFKNNQRIKLQTPWGYQRCLVLFQSMQPSKAWESLKMISENWMALHCWWSNAANDNYVEIYSFYLPHALSHLEDYWQFLAHFLTCLS